MTEQEIKNQILEYLSFQRDFLSWPNASTGIFDTQKGVFRKNRSRFHRNGVSDILSVAPGGILFAIEVKSKKGRLSPEQKVYLDEVNRRGGVGICVRSLDEVISVVATIRQAWAGKTSVQIPQPTPVLF